MSAAKKPLQPCEPNQTPLRPLPSIEEIKAERRGPSKLDRLSLVATDGFALLLAALAATTLQWLYAEPADGIFYLWFGHSAETTLAIFGGFVAIAIARFWSLGHYYSRSPFWDEVREVLRILLLLAVAHAALMYLGKLPFSRLWLVGTWMLALIIVPLSRVVTKRILLKLGRWQLPTLIVGAGENARKAAEALNSEQLMGMEILAFGALNPHEVPSEGKVSIEGKSFPVVLLADPVHDIRSIGCPNVVVALESGELSRVQRLLDRLHLEVPELSIVPALKGLPLYGMQVDHFFRHEALFLRLRNNLSRRAHRILKRAFDIAVSLSLTMLLAPLFAYIALQIRRTGGPAFFGHTRVGRNGVPFTCYKFRTMVPDAERILEELIANDPAAKEEWSFTFKLKNDPRITPIGAFLRKTSLDELPQLINVIKGDMSLVGPRPVVKDELPYYGEHVDYYYEARPGITGLWQISGRSDVDYANRVYLDTWYVKNWSLWQDIVILIKTIKVVLTNTGAY